MPARLDDPHLDFEVLRDWMKPDHMMRLLVSDWTYYHKSHGSTIVP